MTDDTTTAMRALSDALLSMLEQDIAPPCVDGSGAWLDEDREIRAKDAPHCDDCEIRHRCHDFAYTARPRITFGVFAGIDYTPQTRRENLMTDDLTHSPNCERPGTTTTHGHSVDGRDV